MINIWGVYMKDNLIIISNMKKTIINVNIETGVSIDIQTQKDRE